MRVYTSKQSMQISSRRTRRKHRFLVGRLQMKNLVRKERLEACSKRWIDKMDKGDRNGKGGRLGGVVSTLQVSRGRGDCLKPQKDVVKSHQDKRRNSRERCGSRDIKHCFSCIGEQFF